MKKIYFSRKLKQLKVLARRVQFLLKKPDYKGYEQLKRLSAKLAELIHQLRFIISGRELKKTLGIATLVFGLSFSNQVKAQYFESPVENPFSLVATNELAAPAIVDLDGDGDLDMLVGEYYGSMQYFENIGSATDPLFDDPLSDPFGIDGGDNYSFPQFVDIDNDGDYDLFTGTSFYDYLSYEYGTTLNFQENIGTANAPQFASPVENPFELESTNRRLPFPSFVDLDDDGDYDLLLGTSEYTYISYDDYSITGKMSYFENIGSASAAEFASPVDDPFGLSETNLLAAPTFGDIDNDGDMDLFVGEYYGATQYFENTGTAQAPAFAEAEENPFGLVSVLEVSTPALADLDGDGDLDLMIGEYYGNFQYFENVNTVGINELNSQIAIKAYPNPVNDLLTIESEKAIRRAEMIDVLGKTSVLRVSAANQLDLSDASPGMYTLRIVFSDGTYAIKKILKK
jgi:hypothetical protein